MRALFIILGISCLSMSANCQISDNFSDGDYTNSPAWVDNQGHFKVNDEFLLQLDAPDAGSSFIYTPVNLEDSIRWSAYCLMDFAPSGSNLLRIYLAADSTSPEADNSLYFEIGESGSTDALNLYESNNGTASLLASGTMAALGTEPAEFLFTLEKTKANLWSLVVDYGQTGSQLEWDMNLDIPWLDNSVMFGFYMEYTASRTDKFYFDNILVEPLLPDMLAPSVSKVELLSPSNIEIVFSEEMNATALGDISNYTISPSIGNPSQVLFDTENTSVCTLVYPAGLNSGTLYELSISGVTDIAGNAVEQSIHPLALLESATRNDVIVNEMLFNPATGGWDFVEIYNQSDKFINLSSLVIANIQKDSYKDILKTGILYPGDYLAICEDLAWLDVNYNLEDPSALLETDIPLYNDSNGNVSVLSYDQNNVLVMVDSVDYEEDWHYLLLDNNEGVSLERLNFLGDSNDPSNWYSAAATSGFATPGYKNSQFIEGGSLPADADFTLESKVFSPNQDGDNDQLLLRFNLDKQGYLGTLRVYNDRGFFIKEITDNSLFSNAGVISWDGTKNDEQLASVGIYLLVYEFVHPDGDTLKGKLSCVLAQQLD